MTHIAEILWNLCLPAILATSVVVAGCYQPVETCASDCSERQCGPDPVCGLSCGTCPTGEKCTPDGRCQEVCVPTHGGTELCDGVDNDCDGVTDEGEAESCDGCDNDCDGATDEDFAGLGEECNETGCSGDWVCSPDGTGLVCDAPEPADDDATCDGIDDNCDGTTDEDALDQPCALQQGVCAGAVRVCLPGGGWSDCDYGENFTEDVDAICDGVDNDCDGLTDEDAEVLLEPESGDAASDGRDNNCNGLVDEPGGVMVPVPTVAGLWIDVYEATVFEHPDCTGTRFGLDADDYPPGFPADSSLPEVELYACSLPELVPSGYLSWHRARRVCEAQGKSLCSLTGWQTACRGDMHAQWPYGSHFIPGTCNDPVGGEGRAAASGSFESCVSDPGVYDMSGNLAEWIQEWDDGHPGNALTAGFGYQCELCNFSEECAPCDPDQLNQDETGLIEWGTDCIPGPSRVESLPRDMLKPYLGVRCCYRPE